MSVEHDTVWQALLLGAETHGDAPLLRVDGEQFSYVQCLEATAAVAAGVTEFGLSTGDRVAVMADNRQETLWSWLGITAAGAVEVPLNTASQGQALTAQLEGAAPRMLVGTVDYLTRIAKTCPSSVELVVSIGESVDPSLFEPRVRHVPWNDLMMAGKTSALPPQAPNAAQTATVLYTSGTTGPSKGTMIPQRYYPVWGRRGADYVDLLPGEKVYCAQPLFHVDARAYFLVALMRGGTSVIGTRFSVSKFWDEIRTHDANVFSYIGTMLWLLYKQPESERDRDHHVRVAGGAATPGEIHRAFEERFGLRLLEAYGMTESLFLAHAKTTTPLGSVGTVVPELEGRLVDDFDQPVEAGQPGELIVRPREPFVTAQGYWQMPAETVEATRNLWLHTGDLLRSDEEGHLYFVGRKKDSIRRRVENVSAWEIEQRAMQHPDVLEAAAIGVPSPLGEEDVALLLVLRPGVSPTHDEVRHFVAAELPAFAAPRYVEFVDEFAKTASERVDKGLVRARGLSDAAWDVES